MEQISLLRWRTKHNCDYRLICNTDIIIENIFSYDDVLKLSELCNYEPFCDEPEAEDLIQLAAFTKDTHCLVGFISCLNPIINCNTDDSDDIDTHNNSDTIKPSIYDDMVIYRYDCP